MEKSSEEFDALGLPRNPPPLRAPRGPIRYIGFDPERVDFQSRAEDIYRAYMPRWYWPLKRRRYRRSTSPGLIAGVMVRSLQGEVEPVRRFGVRIEE